MQKNLSQSQIGDKRTSTLHPSKMSTCRRHATLHHTTQFYMTNHLAYVQPSHSGQHVDIRKSLLTTRKGGIVGYGYSSKNNKTGTQAKTTLGDGMKGVNMNRIKKVYLLLVAKKGILRNNTTVVFSFHEPVLRHNSDNSTCT